MEPGGSCPRTAPSGCRRRCTADGCRIAGARGGAAGLRARPRRLLRRAQGGRGHQSRRAGRGLGAARMGGAGRAVVGAGGLHSRAVLAGLGRPAGCEQHGHQQHDRGQRAEHQRLPQQHRAERRGGGARKPLRPRAHHVSARRTGGRDEPPADAHGAPDCHDAGELRAHGEPRRPATGGECPAAGGGDTPAARPVRGGPRRSAERRAGRGAHARAAPRLRTATARERPDSYSSSLWPEHGRAPHRGSRPTAVAAGGTQESTIAAPAAAGAAEGDLGADRTPAVTRSCGSATASGASSRGPRGHCPSTGHTPAVTKRRGNAAAAGPSSRGARGYGSGACHTPAVTRSGGSATASRPSSRGGPVVGWVPLGWGEPVVPWWGREGVIHEPSWRGWGGPRVVNNTVINNTTVVNVQNINVYRNSSVQNAVVVVHENHFGHGPITSARAAQVDVTSLRPTHSAPQMAATPASFVPTASRGVRPPEGSVQRPVVATRLPHARSEAAPGGARNVGPAGVPTPAPRLVSVPPRPESGPIPTRPAFGQSTVE